MRFLTGLVLLAVAGLLAGCEPSPESGQLRLRHPSPTVANMAVLPTLSPLSTAIVLPAATELPTPTPLPPVAPLPAATDLPVSTPLPTVALLPAATVAPTVTPLPAATELPAPTPLPTVTPASSRPAVSIGGFSWPVELAITGQEQAQGLSGRAELAAGSGMLFVWAQESRRSFWMPDMNFPLDLVWINGDCTVVEITRDAPPQAPGQSRSELPRYIVDNVQYVLEINAGESAQYGLNPGDRVKFGGSLAGEYGC